MIAIDTNILHLQSILDISNRRMKDYAASTVDEILQAEAAQGNTQALTYARKLYKNTGELIELFRLYDPENKFQIISSMNAQQRDAILPMLEVEDMVLGMQFFTKDKLLELLKDIEPEEMVRLMLNTFNLEDIMMLMPEDELQQFFENKEVRKEDVAKHLKALPPELMQQLMESLTGQPSFEVDSTEVINMITSLGDRDYEAVMASIDPLILRQVIFSMSSQKPEYLELFDNEVYTEMLSTLMKPEIIKPMEVLKKETLMDMMMEMDI
jgi:Mg/Co/Ni transporter MgtE